MIRRFVCVLFVSAFVVACAASPKRAANEPASKTAAQPAQEPAGYAGGQPSTGDAAKNTEQQPSPPPPAPPASPQGGFAPPPPSRGVAQAQSDVESAQRELDVAAGDCKNACRALRSMDNAAGRLCGLAQSSDESRRCDDAKKKVYTARDRVKSTCGKCDDVTVDRNAPIPSRP